MTITFKHGHGVALSGQIVGGGHTGRTRSYNSNLFGEVFVNFGNEAVFRLQFLVGNKLLDIVNCHGFINTASYALIFAAVEADSATYRGEGIITLDNLERFIILTFGCLADIALNGDVSGALGLAGADVLLIDHDLLVPLGIDLGLSPCILGGVLEHNGSLGLNTAEAVAKANGVHVADFDAGTACHAFFRINVGHIVGTGDVRESVPHIL